MGCVIATLYARHGYKVVICDTQFAMLDSYAERARPIAASFSDDGAEVEVFTRRCGTPGAPALVCVHGFPTSSIDFAALTRELDGEFEFFVVDGNSGFPTSGSIEIDSSLTFRGAQGLYCSAYQLRKRPPHPYLLGHVGKAVEIVG